MSDWQVMRVDPFQSDRDIQRMAEERLIQHICERTATWTDLPVVVLRVGDYLEISGHRYLMHVASNNQVVLAPAPALPELKMTLSE